jgi:D-3-phosphoglycerate dehydrogenase
MKKVLLAPSSFGEIDREPIDLLVKNGFEPVANPFKRKLTEPEVIDLAGDCVGIIAGLEPLNRNVIDACPELKCISRVGVGMENVDIPYARERGIIVLNTPDGPTQAVAELTLAMTLALLRRIPLADANMRKGKWRKETGNLLAGKSVGVVGLGRIGKKVAGIFRALGNTVVGYDLSPDLKWCYDQGVESLTLDELLSRSEIVTLHIPGNPDKKPVFTDEVIARMKPKSVLVNLARGDVVDEAALEDALRTGRLAGAALDVFSREPYEGGLLALENVVLTPHLGSYAEEGKLKMEIDAVRNFLNAVK